MSNKISKGDRLLVRDWRGNIDNTIVLVVDGISKDRVTAKTIARSNGLIIGKRSYSLEQLEKGTINEKSFIIWEDKKRKYGIRGHFNLKKSLLSDENVIKI